jgi:hypothetical protein
MGDRTTVTVTVRGIDRAYWRRIENWLMEEWSADGTCRDADMTGSWYIHEASLGSAPEIAEGLLALMGDLDEAFAYRIEEDPHSATDDGYWEGAIPDGAGGWWTAAGQVGFEGADHVAASEVDQVIADWRAGLAKLTSENVRRSMRFEDPVDPAEDLVERLDALTERGWRKTWDAIDDVPPEPPEEVEEEHGTFVVTI